MSVSVQAAELTQVNDNLMNIFSRMKQKYSEHEAQQAAIAADETAAEIAAEVAKERQSLDTHTQPVSARQTNVDQYDDFVGSRFAEGEELILSSTLNELELASLIAIKSADGLQIGLGDFLQIVEIPISVNVDALTASGWFQKESNKFSLEPLGDGRLKVSFNAQNYTINADEFVASDDLYIELSYIEKWFGLSSQLNEEGLVLALTSSEKLPVEARANRLNRSVKGINTHSTVAVLPLKDSRYQLFSPPMLDIQTAAQQSEHTYRTNIGNDTFKETKVNNNSGRYSILASHDLAYLNTELFLAGSDQDSLSSAWLTFSRQSLDAELLGPLQATEYAFGDVTPVNASLGGTHERSLGFMMGNTPINQLVDNRRVNLTGELQEGWDVELYRNRVLIDQRLGVSEGRYEFNDVALEYGNNDFELIFYGPQGQIERKQESYLVDGNTVSTGELQYRFSVVELGQTLFGVYDNGYENRALDGTMASATLDYGITDWLALTAGSSVFQPKEGDLQEFISLGANISLGTMGLINTRFEQDQNDLNVMQMSYRTRWWDTTYSFSAQRQEYLDIPIDSLYHRDSYDATMSGQLFAGSALPISYQNTWHRSDSDREDMRSEYIQNGIGIGNRFGYLSNNIAWHKEASVNVFDPLVDPLADPIAADSVLGSLGYRKSFGRLHSRFFGNYEVKPTKQFNSYGAIFNYNWTANVNTEFRYTEYLQTDLYQTNIALNWRKDAFYLNTNAGYNENGAWTAGIGLRFSLGYEPLGRSVFTSGRPIAQSGAVAARVFEDLNMNGIFDADEPLIQGATVKAVQGYRESKTNQDGVAVISALHNNSITDIVVDESTLGGPFMIRGAAGVSIQARKGYIDTVDLPVVKAGEVAGIIYQKDKAGENNPAPYIMLNLLNNKNQVMASARSEFDGYYLFTNVKPGAYTLKVDEGYLERSGLKENQQRLNFSSEGDVIEGVDFTLRPLDEAQGYIASAGHFKTPELLKLYYHILRNKVGDKFVQTPFFIKQPDQKGYILGLAYFAGNPVTGRKAELSALEACQKLASYNIHCEVQYHDFKY